MLLNLTATLQGWSAQTTRLSNDTLFATESHSNRFELIRNQSNGEPEMKAAVYYGPGDIRIEERPEPTATNDNLIAKIHCCAICGTDLKLATIGNPRCHPPRIIGHEMVGTVLHVGADVDGFSVGERITLATTVACGSCHICGLGLGNLCPNAMPISYDFDGAFAETISIPPDAIQRGNVINVPDSVSNEAAALSEPFSCAINAQELVELKPGDSVLIIGGGPLGAIHAELARANNVKKVMLVQRSEPRLSMLRRIEGLIVIDGSREDVASIVSKHTSELGADVVIVCAPNRKAQEDCLKYVRKGGAISLFASLPKGASEITIDSRLLHYGELRLVGASDSRPEHVKKAVQMMESKRISPERLITHRIDLKDLSEGLELMKRKACLKVLIYPSGVSDETGS